MFVLELSEQEKQALLGLIDAGVRSIGLRAAHSAAFLAAKIEAAPQKPVAPPAPDAS